MAERPAPPFETQLSEQAEDDLSRRPELAADTNAIVLRAARELRRRLEEGENEAIDLHGRREQLSVRVSLIPPNTLRIEGIAPGAKVPEGAIVV
jgi:hypothetical protein